MNNSANKTGDTRMRNYFLLPLLLVGFGAGSVAAETYMIKEYSGDKIIYRYSAGCIKCGHGCRDVTIKRRLCSPQCNSCN